MLRVSEFNGIVLTKLAYLTALKIKICTASGLCREIAMKNSQKELNILEKCEPVYEEVSGWKENTGGVKF